MSKISEYYKNCAEGWSTSRIKNEIKELETLLTRLETRLEIEFNSMTTSRNNFDKLDINDFNIALEVFNQEHERRLI